MENSTGIVNQKKWKAMKQKTIVKNVIFFLQLTIDKVIIKAFSSLKSIIISSPGVRGKRKKNTSCIKSQVKYM